MYYELSNHLGNVLAVVSDRKVPTTVNSTTGLGAIDHYDADVVQYTDYYPFGMQMPERFSADNDYRYGFQGMEGDDEVKGDGNSYTTEFRQYDSRVGRWLSIDPVVKAWESPYVGYSNNPIYYIDPSGLTPTGNDDEKKKNQNSSSDQQSSNQGQKYYDPPSRTGNKYPMPQPSDEHNSSPMTPQGDGVKNYGTTFGNLIRNSRGEPVPPYPEIDHDNLGDYEHADFGKVDPNKYRFRYEERNKGAEVGSGYRYLIYYNDQEVGWVDVRSNFTPKFWEYYGEGNSRVRSNFKKNAKDNITYLIGTGIYEDQSKMPFEVWVLGQKIALINDAGVYYDYFIKFGEIMYKNNEFGPSTGDESQFFDPDRNLKKEGE